MVVCYGLENELCPLLWLYVAQWTDLHSTQHISVVGHVYYTRVYPFPNRSSRISFLPNRAWQGDRPIIEFIIWKTASMHVATGMIRFRPKAFVNFTRPINFSFLFFRDISFMSDLNLWGQVYYRGKRSSNVDFLTCADQQIFKVTDTNINGEYLSA